MKDNLLFISTKGRNQMIPKIFGPDRSYDIALHDYNLELNAEGDYRYDVEYYLRTKGEKLATAGRWLQLEPKLMRYQSYAFFDDDLVVNAKQLDELFLIGTARQLNLYQAPLTRDSIAGWPILVTNGVNEVREVPHVEIMMPFFSKTALEWCLPTFTMNESGLGLDVFVWPIRTSCHVVDFDHLAVGHNKSGKWDRKLINGKLISQEWAEARASWEPTPPIVP
jgi:hypothetical protein